MGFPSSNKPIVTTLQENINSMANLVSASQSPKNPEDGHPKTSSENGFLAMENSHSSSERIIVGNQVSAEVTPYFEATIEQPSQLVIDKNSLSTDVVNQMDLDRLADAKNVNIRPYE